MSKVVAVVGSYRRGGNTDRVVEAILAGAREKGAETETIHLLDRPIEFCTNCRECAQAPGTERGRCVQKDGLEALLCELETADALVMASPVNYGNTTAIFRRFLERTLGYASWPWGGGMPKGRRKELTRKAVLVATGAMPGFLIPLTTGTGTALGMAAQALSARVVGRLWVGFMAQERHPALPAKVLAKARQLGWKLA
ncbi:MAG: flavodoxin family protein [Terracidiphilus sp.]